jgi:hypothetical protein
MKVSNKNRKPANNMICVMNLNKLPNKLHIGAVRGPGFLLRPKNMSSPPRNAPNIKISITIIGIVLFQKIILVASAPIRLSKTQPIKPVRYWVRQYIKLNG